MGRGMNGIDGRLVLCGVKGCHCKRKDDDLGMVHIEDNGRNGYVPRDWATLFIAAQDLLKVAVSVAGVYEYEQTKALFPPGRTWGTITHELGQAARAAVAKAAGKKT